MSEEPTIVFELTPKEASILCEMLSLYSWEKGPYGEMVRAMYFELDKEIGEEISYLDTVSTVGSVETGAIWLEDFKLYSWKKAS